MPDRILVTGASGFIGSRVVAEALDRGHQVLALDRRGRLIPGAKGVQGSLDAIPWKEIVDFRPNVCIHSAWISTPGVYLEAPENRGLVTDSLHLIEGLFEKGLEFCIILGTCIEYGMTGQRLREDVSPIQPASLYARCKNELREQLLTKQFNFAWCRVFYPYGLGEHPLRFSSVLIRELRAGNRFTINTPDSKKDYIHILDLAKAIVTILEKRHKGDINLGTGLETSVGDFARSVGRLLGRESLLADASPPAKDPYPYVVADTTRLRSLGWTPQISLEDGLANLIEHFPKVT